MNKNINIKIIFIFTLKVMFLNCSHAMTSLLNYLSTTVCDKSALICSKISPNNCCLLSYIKSVLSQLAVYRFSKTTSLISLSLWEDIVDVRLMRGERLASWSRYGRLMSSVWRVARIILKKYGELITIIAQ